MLVELQDPPARIEFNDLPLKRKAIFSHGGKDGVVLEKLRHGWMQLKTGQPILEKNGVRMVGSRDGGMVIF